MDDVDSWLTLDSTWVGPGSIPVRILEHLYYSGLAVLAAMLIGLPLGLLIGHTGRARTLVSTIAGLWRALPTLGLVILVFRLAPLSLWPVIVAWWSLRSHPSCSTLMQPSGQSTHRSARLPAGWA